MRHDLDIKPISEDILFVNDLTFLAPDIYESYEELAKATKGETVKNGGLLPEDNVRIYLPLDLNADSIMTQLRVVYLELGSPTEETESAFCSRVRYIIRQLEVYDQVMVSRNIGDAIQMAPGGVYHSKNAIDLAKRMVDLMLEDEGCAECYPYDFVEELKEEFGI